MPLMQKQLLKILVKISQTWPFRNFEKKMNEILVAYLSLGWLGSRVVSVLDSGAEGPGSNRSRDAVG